LAPALDRLLQSDDRGPLLLEGPTLVLARDAERDQLPVELRDLVLPLLEGRPRPLKRNALLLELPQRLLARQALPLERCPGLDESGPLLPELLLRRDDRGDLVGEAGLQLLGLLGLLLGLALPGPRSLEGCAVLLKLGADRGHLRLPLSRHGARPRQVFPRPLQRLIPVDERRADLLDGGDTLRGPALQLQEVVSQGFRPVRQPPVVGPQGLDEGVEGVALLLQPAELGAHLVEGAVSVPGANLQLLPSTNEGW
jgi:hypothetical protein